jgi:hypothetical protein
MEGAVVRSRSEKATSECADPNRARQEAASSLPLEFNNAGCRGSLALRESHDAVIPSRAREEADSQPMRELTESDSSAGRKTPV